MWHILLVGQQFKESHQLRLVVQLALEVVEIKQTTTRLEINPEKK